MHMRGVLKRAGRLWRRKGETRAELKLRIDSIETDLGSIVTDVVFIAKDQEALGTPLARRVAEGRMLAQNCVIHTDR